ncbi:MAG: ribosome small subunit-dependent GTPase A [Cytophagaceae bacterium]|jgi:ribosome biogenesis GTPase|nr:ribosome small subunit-dependent GTPase A [Cytophagaceae bacterium]
MKKGVVIKSTGSQYLVQSENEAPLTCKIKGKFRLEDLQSTNPVAVGDCVMFHIDDQMEGEGVITEILERKNYIIRRSTNLSKQTQILAANIDQALLLATVNFPVTTTVFIDRFIASAEAYNIPVILVFNKVDRYDYRHFHEMENLMEVYNKIGYQTISISAKKQESLDDIKTLLENRVTLIAGHSGAGKSTLVNRLEPGLKLKTADISAAHNTGKHTTTFAEMHPFSFGGYVIDTPGIGGFGLVGIAKEELYHYFKEIFAASKNCRFHNCTHLREPGCAVKAAVDGGEIAYSRYASYISILMNKDEKYR